MDIWHSYVCNDCDGIFDVTGDRRHSHSVICPDCLSWHTELFPEEEQHYSDKERPILTVIR